MKFKLNDEDFESKMDITISDLLELKEIDIRAEAMTVKINGDFISMKKYKSTMIKENDDVWLVRFSPGG